MGASSAQGATDRPSSWYIVFESAALYDFMLRGTMVTLSPVHHTLLAVPPPQQKQQHQGKCLGCGHGRAACAHAARVLGYALEGA